MKKWIALLILLIPALAYPQGVRIDNIAIQGGNPLRSIPNAVVTICTSAGTGTPCTPLATTYTDVTLATPCPGGAQLVLANTSTCAATADTLGNYGAWVAPGTYILTVTAIGLPPYSTTLTLQSSLSGTPNIIPVGSASYPATAAGINLADSTGLGSSNGSILVTAPGSYCDTIISLSNGHTLNFGAGTYQVNIAGADSSVANVTWAVEGLGSNVTEAQGCPGVSKPVITSQNFASFTGGSNAYGVSNPLIKGMTIDGNGIAPYGIQIYGLGNGPFDVKVQNTATGHQWWEYNGVYTPVWPFTGGFSSTGPNSLSGLTTVSNLDGILAVDGVNYTTLQTAYAACPSNGCHIIVGTDLTVTGTGETLNLTAGKPLFLDFAGRTLSCANTSGVCLLIYKADTTPRDPFEMANGIVSYTGLSGAVTGIKIGDATHTATNLYVHGMSFENFSTASSVGLNLTKVQDSHFDSISYTSNTLALSLNLDSNQDQFSNNWFQENVNAVTATDASEITFEDCLVQSNTGTKSVQVISTTVNVTLWKFKHCHFENNGDTTNNTRQVSFSAAAGKSITQTEFDSNTFNGGTNAVAGSYVYEAIGSGTVNFFNLKNNIYFTTTNFFTGALFVPQMALTSENDNAFPVDTALAPNLITGCVPLTGIGFAPLTSTNKFQIYGGWPGQFNGDLVVHSCGAVNADILRYETGNSWWNFLSSGGLNTTAITTAAVFNARGLQIFNTTTSCTTAGSVGAICTTAGITLPIAEADTSYRVVCTGKGLTNVPVVIATTNSSTTQFTITIAALTAAAASFASYDCTVGHN